MLFNAYYAGTFTQAKPNDSILWLGWSMPGPGRWWIEDGAFFMHRTFHPWPMRLEAAEITDITETKGLGLIGRLTGPYIRLYWQSTNTPVYSSFALNKLSGQDDAPVQLLKKLLK